MNEKGNYNMTTSRLRLKTPLAIAAAVLLAFAPLAHADTLQDIGKMMKQGQNSQALDRIDQYLSSNPKDPQGRFLKGLILTELNRQADAIVVFTKLTEEFPESPEPYNNLAVIYAQQKQYDKARQALEMAIRTHPSYATAHENLGDIYAHMASQAYDKALSIDSSNTSAQTKLSMIRDMMTGQVPSVLRPNQHLTLNNKLTCGQLQSSVKDLFQSYKVAQAPVGGGLVVGGGGAAAGGGLLAGIGTGTLIAGGIGGALLINEVTKDDASPN